MSRRVTLELNRVEGDLEIDVEVADGKVADAWCRGTLYRGFEQLMIGRDPLDALAITPRVCGICSTSHLMASVMALENALAIAPPPDAIRVRNICQMAETAQSDLRQTFLMFAIDFCRPPYAAQPFFARACEAFAEQTGRIWHGALDQSRKLVQIVAHFAGQWPHSSHMVPGGVTTPEITHRSLNALQLLYEVEDWLAAEVFGGRAEAFLEVADGAGLKAWLAARPSALALLDECMRGAGLDTLGHGAPALLSYGCHPDPDQWTPEAPAAARALAAGTLVRGTTGPLPLDISAIREDTSHAWYLDSESSRHPAAGSTVPRYLPDGERYTWNKAPRYGGQVVQVGPIAQLAVGGDPLIVSLFQAGGDTPWLRQLSRLRRLAHDVVRLRRELDILVRQASPQLYAGVKRPVSGSGFGLVEATRGSLGHWLSFEDNRITGFQIISPTSWNASPRDAAGVRGHWESSLIGLAVDDEDNPLLIGHVIRSHDPCLVCAVHLADREGRKAARVWQL